MKYLMNQFVKAAITQLIRFVLCLVGMCLLYLAGWAIAQAIHSIGCKDGCDWENCYRATHRIF